MLLHPAIAEISSRADRIADAVRKGRLPAGVGKYARPGWAYLYKGLSKASAALAIAKAGNALDSFSSADDGAIAYVVTTDEEDRDGDIVLPMGAQLANYSRNPIVFFGHQEWEIPIGVCRSPDGRITVYPEENRMIDVIYFDRDDPDADFIYQKCQRKILNATSIAFVPIEAERRSDFRKARTHGDHGDQIPGWLFRRWDKTEVSIVGVPSNPSAVGLEKDLQGACRDCYDREKGEMSPKLRKAWIPYCATAKGKCWTGWCPLPEGEIPVAKKPAKKAEPAKKTSAKTTAKKSSRGCGNCAQDKPCSCKKGKGAAKTAKHLGTTTNIVEDGGSFFVKLPNGKTYGPYSTYMEAQNQALLIEKNRKQATQADLDSPGVPGRNPNPPGNAEQGKALGESSGRIGGYAVPPTPIQDNEAPAERMDDAVAEGWATCDACHGDGNCAACGGVGTKDGEECGECGSVGECPACVGEGHVKKSILKSQRMLKEEFVTEALAREAIDKLKRERPDTKNHQVRRIPTGQIGYGSKFTYKVVFEDPAKSLTSRKQNSAGHTPPQIAPQAEDVVGPKMTTPQVIAALYSHAKAEAAYLDQLDEQFKDTLSDYRRQQVEERMDMLKYQFSRAAGPDDDIEKLCKDFEDQHDKGMATTGPDQTVEPGEAGLVEQGQIPPEPEVEKNTCSRCGGEFDELTNVCPGCGADARFLKKVKTMKQNTAAADGAYIEGDKDAAAELDASAAPFNKEAPSTEDWEEEKADDEMVDLLEPPPQAPPKPSPSGDMIDLGKPPPGARKAPPGTAEWAEEEANEPAHKAIRIGECPLCEAQWGPSDEQYARENGECPDCKGSLSGPALEKADEAPIVEPPPVETPVGKVCMCGMDTPDGANYCAGCGTAVNKDDMEEMPAPVPDTVVSTEDVATIEEEPPVVLQPEVEAEPLPKGDMAQSTDPSTDEILERYRNPKSNKWATRKWIVARQLLPFLKYRVAADGQKYLVRSKQQTLADTDELNEGEVKALTTKLASAIDDLKALVKAPDLPKHYKAGLKHVADQIWYVGKALTDKGKEQRTGGSGSVLSNDGKVQANGGKGSALSDKGELQASQAAGQKHGEYIEGSGRPQTGKSINPLVAREVSDFRAFLRRQGILNGN